MRGGARTHRRGRTQTGAGAVVGAAGGALRRGRGRDRRGRLLSGERGAVRPGRPRRDAAGPERTGDSADAAPASHRDACPDSHGLAASTTACWGSTSAPTTIWSSRSPCRSPGPHSCAPRRGRPVDVVRLSSEPGARPHRACVVRGDRLIDLTAREFELLEYLLRHQGHLVSREMLARDVWREPRRATPLDNVIDVQMTRLRRKIDLEGSPRLIHTVRGVGFRLREGEP